MKKKVYSVLVEHFKGWGITHIFGIPGKSISPLMVEMDIREIEYVLGRHETGSGYEASGYALGKKSLGVAIGTSGPGGTNLITSAGQAKEYQLPVLFITGQPSIQDTGRALSQDSSQFGTDLVKMFEPVTLFSARVERGDMLPLMLRHALERACTGVKGPVHLCIPFDVLMEEIDPFFIPLPEPVMSAVSPDSEIDKGLAWLSGSRKPVLFLGKGVMMADAYEEIRILAETWSIPVVTAPGGKGAFPTNHPLSLGGYGLGGAKQASDYLKSGTDLMIVAGCKMCDMALSGFTKEMHPERVLQLEYDLTFAGKSLDVPTHLLLGDIKYNLNRLIERSDRAVSGEGQASPAACEAAATAVLSRTAPASAPARQPEADSKGALSAGAAFRALRGALPPEAILFGDAGSHSFHAVQHFEIVQPGTFFFDEVFIAMGAAIGYSIGAKLACPDKPIVCVTGDGCIMMHGTEISTAVNHEAPVLFVVLNNGRLDMVDKGMSYNTGRSVGAVYKKPLDVSMFARSMGAEAYCCRNETEIGNAVEAALQSKNPSVIEVMVDPLEVPPILTRLLSLD